MVKDKYFQITTAIDYPSARPHVGHTYEKICADVIARWKRLKGFKVHFSTGTDCHGLKLQRTAEKAGKKPEQFVKEMSNLFRELCELFNISYDDFIMTIEKRHEDTVLNILKNLEKKGDIYRGEYEGLYCVDCETFYTEKDLVNGKCPYHPNKKIELFKEETYFFKLSKYQKDLIKNIEDDKLLIWPNKKKKEILNRLEEPLKDLSISRANVSWGIPLPFDKKKTIAVWNDALVNYLSTVDYPNKEFSNFWPAVHMIGSDIVWHHTVIWGAMLLALKAELPKVIVHGFVNLEGKKLSKASGINIDPIGLSKKYGADSIRYFLMRNIPFGEDGDFDEKALIARHNNELANKLGNLVSRVAGLIEKFGVEKFENKIRLEKRLKKSIENGEAELRTNEEGCLCIFRKHKGARKGRVSEVIQTEFLSEHPISWLEAIELFVDKDVREYQFDKALNKIFAFIDHCNWYIQVRKIWETKDKKDLFELKESILKIAELLSPFIPESAEKIKKQFSAKKIKKGEILFKKI